MSETKSRVKDIYDKVWEKGVNQDLFRFWKFWKLWGLSKGFIPQSGRVLDAGCGEGRFIDKIYVKNQQVIGADLSIKGLQKCKHGETVLADIENLPFKDESFSGLLSVGVIYVAPNPDQAIKECSRVLKKWGILILTAPNLLTAASLKRIIRIKLNRYKWGPFCNHFTPFTMSRLLRTNGFRIRLFDGVAVISYEWLQLHVINYKQLRVLEEKFPRKIRAWFAQELVVIASKVIK